MNRKIKYICLFILVLFLFTNKVFAYDYSKSCYKQSVEEVAKILFSETGCTFLDDPDSNFFVNASVAAVAINNANVDYQTQNMASKSNWDKKVYYLRDGAYALHSSYRDSSVESIAAYHGCSNLIPKMYYISALALSGKFTFRTNMMGQAAPYLATQYCDPPGGWHVFQTAPNLTEICYLKGIAKSTKDVFGNEIPDDSFEYYKRLAKSLMKSDYSEYTSGNVCGKVANISGTSLNENNIGNENSDGNSNPQKSKCIVSVNVPVCENPDFLKVIYFGDIILGILKIVIPIALIIMGMIDFSKSVVNNNDGEQRKNVKLFIKRIIYAILVFALPWIVKTIIINLGDFTKDVTFTDCLKNANDKDISKYQNKYDELYEAAKNNCNNSGNNSTSENNNNDSIGNSSNNGSDSNSNNNKRLNNTIFIGDSRTVGMFNCINKESNAISIAQSGMGYNWLVTTANSKLQQNIGRVGDSYIAINMGTNSGLTESEAGQYAKYYNDVAKKYPNSQVIAISVTQIKAALAKSKGMYAGASITDESVNKFNSALKSKLDSNVIYCDVYSKIAGSYNTSDGVHYDCPTYQKIYNAIKECIK